ISRKLFTYRHKLVATEEFIAKFGKPETPQDLYKFPCAAWGKKEISTRWHLGNEVINLTPKIKANDYAFMRFLVHSHTCITELPDSLIAIDKDARALIEILPEFPLPYIDINLIYPSKKQLSRIARTYIDFCVDNAARYLTF
ncbi:MAG: LysR substrate-binding domain-containing protein, partial [Cellvibrio sp.]